MPVRPMRRPFTVREYHRMGKAGILAPDERVELIEGEIIKMPPIGGPHASRVNRVSRAFHPVAGGAAILSVQNPLRLSDLSEPVPDLMLLRPRDDFYETHPAPADVLLLVEVSDTTLDYDQRTKLPLYAREGVPETWIVDLVHTVLLVHREPSSTGYQISLKLERGDYVSALAFPDLRLAAEDVLG